MDKTAIQGYITFELAWVRLRSVLRLPSISVLMPGSIFSHLRIIPTGHTQPLPPRPTPPVSENIYDALVQNPYLPFYHIWKPATPWSKAKWEKGTEEGLARQKPDYYAAIIEYVSFYKCSRALLRYLLPYPPPSQHSVFSVTHNTT